MKLNKTNFQIRFKRGLAANVNTDATKYLAVEGEPHWTTDTKQLYIFDGTQNLWIPVADSSGVLKIPAAGSDYLQISATGVLTLAGAARVWKEIQIYPSSFAPGASGATETLTGNYDGWAYSINDEMVASLEIPDDWDSSTDLKVRVYWYINEAYAANSGEVRWQIEWSACPTDETEAVDAPTHTGTIDFGDVNIPATAKYLTRTAQGTISAASLSVGDLMGLKLKRIALVDGNNPTAEPVVVNLEIEYISNKLGEEV